MSCDTFSSELGTGDARLRTTACCTFSLLIPIRVVVGVFSLHHCGQTLASLHIHSSPHFRVMQHKSSLSSQSYDSLTWS